MKRIAMILFTILSLVFYGCCTTIDFLTDDSILTDPYMVPLDIISSPVEYYD